MSESNRVSEATIQRRIQRYIESYQGKVIKTQGIEVGTPDLIGVMTIGSRVYPLAVEVKRPGEKLKPIQHRRLREWAKAGAIALSASSVREFAENFYRLTGVRLEHTPADESDDNETLETSD